MRSEAYKTSAHRQGGVCVNIAVCVVTGIAVSLVGVTPQSELPPHDSCTSR